MIGARGEPAVVDQNIVAGVLIVVERVGVVVDLSELQRRYERRIGGDAVEANVDGGIAMVEEEVGVGAGAGDGFGPRGSP